MASSILEEVSIDPEYVIWTVGTAGVAGVPAARRIRRARYPAAGCRGMAADRRCACGDRALT